MNGVVFFTARQLVRNVRRSVAVLGALTLAVAMAAAILLYISGSAADLTQTALRPVAADFVAHATTQTVDPEALATAYAATPGVAAAEPFVAADFASLTSAGGDSATAPGKVFATTDKFVRTFPFVVTSEGAFAQDGILLSEASAIRLGVHVGDDVRLAIGGGAKVYQVTGILDAAAAEPLFASGDPNFEGDFTIVPDVVVMPYSLYRADSEAAGAPTSPAATSPADVQVYVQLDRSRFAGDPTSAQKQIDAFSRELERQNTGQVKITNNDDSALKHAKQDILGAKVLFVFLGLPGIAVAGFLAHAASQVFREESRRDVGLLRARGARPRQIYAAATLFALSLGLVASLLGTIIGEVAAGLTTGGTFGLSSLVVTFALTVPITLVIALLAVIVPAAFSLKRDITDERRLVPRSATPPFWERFGLDFVALALSGLFFGITYLAGGFRPTTAEGQSISLAFYVFLGPLFLWTGLTLLLVRYLRQLLPATVQLIRRVIPMDGFGGVGATDLSRRPQLAGIITAVVALTFAFGVSTLAFTGTYSQERERDSRFAVGSDVRMTVSSAGTSASGVIEPALQQPGVVAYSGFLRDTNALVGSKRQTVYGIDPASFLRTAFLPGSFFANGSARKTLDALAANPNGVLVSREEAIAFNIVVGDPLFIRLSSTDAGGYCDVRLVVVGITNHFPTSSQDSDFIMNRDAMAAAANRPQPRNDVYLLKVANTNPVAVVTSIEAALPAGAVAKFQDVRTVARIDESSLTNLNVVGLGGLQQAFAYVLVAGAMFAFTATLITTRKKDLSTMRALGGSLGQVRRLVAVQAATVAAAALVIGVPVGLLLGWVLVRLLAIIFPIPVDHTVFVSSRTIAFLSGSLIAVVASLLAASVAIARTSVGVTLRDQ